MELSRASKPSKQIARRSSVSLRSTTHSQPQRLVHSIPFRPSRRCLLTSTLSVVLGLEFVDQNSRPALAGLPAEVGSYLPTASDPQYALFVPDSKKTPALRAGTLDPFNPYKFEIPVSFREGKVANILSGNFCQVWDTSHCFPRVKPPNIHNYCQPRCDEPWTEVVFEDASAGRIAVWASPLKKLTNKVNASLEDIGAPDTIVLSIGSYITGTFLDEENVISIDTKKQDDGRTYYYYEVDAPFGTLGRHSFSALTTKGDVAMLLVANASDQQWGRSKAQLKHVAESFRA